MKRKKLLTIILGIAIFAGILCSGIIIATGIQTGTASAHNTSPRKERYPQPYKLEKTKIEEFSEASIHLDYANISILPSDGFYLEYRLDGTCEEPDYEVSSGKLYLQEGPTLKQYSISFNLFGNPVNREPFYLNLYVPKDQYLELLNLTTENGNVELEQINARKAELYLSYGNLYLKEFTGDILDISIESGDVESKTITCDDLSISSSYGNVTGGNISVSNQADLTLDSGNLEISQLTADMLSLDIEYGTCTIDSITSKTGKFALDSGNLNLRNAVLEHADINSEYGNVTLGLSDKSSDCNYDLKTEYGTIEVDGKNIKAEEDGTVVYQKQDSQKEGEIIIRCDSGNINIR